MSVYISQALYDSGTLNSGRFNPDNPVIGYHNLIQYSGVLAESETPEFPASNLANPATYEYWLSGIGGEQHVEFMFPFSNYDYLALADHNLAGMTYRWQKKAGIGGAWEDITNDRLIEDNNAVMDLPVQQASDYVRLKIIAPTHSRPRIGVVFIGLKLRLPSRIYVGHNPITLAKKVKSANVFNEDMAFMGRVVTKLEFTSSFTQDHIDPAYLRNFIAPWLDHALSDAWFFAWRPSSYPGEVAYCVTQGSTTPGNQLANGMMSFNVSFRGLAFWV